MPFESFLKTALGCGVLVAMSGLQPVCAQKKKMVAAVRAARPHQRLVPDSSLLKNLPAEDYSQVTGYRERFQGSFTALRRRHPEYLSFIEALLAQNGLPDDLKILSLIESNVNPEAVSVAGAVGIWQIMPLLAKEHQLSNEVFDERKDMYKSAQVAVRYLRTLYTTYPDRLLVVAAYNCGPGRLAAALKNLPGGSSFWRIKDQLPAETRNHVLKYLAGVSIFYNLTPSAASAPPKAPPVAPAPPEALLLRPREVAGTPYLSLRITPSYQPEAIIRYTGINADTFEQLNPRMRERFARDGTYELKLPKREMLQFLAQKSQILKASREVPAPR